MSNVTSQLEGHHGMNKDETPVWSWELAFHGDRFSKYSIYSDFWFFSDALCRNVQVAYLDNSNNHSHRGVPWDRWNKDSDGARIKVILNEKNKRDMSVFPRLIPVINFAGSMTYRLIWLTLAATRLVQWCLIFIASLVGVKKLVGCWRDTTLSVSVSIPRGNWWGMSLPEYGHHFPLAGVCGQIQ